MLIRDERKKGEVLLANDRIRSPAGQKPVAQKRGGKTKIEGGRKRKGLFD